MATVLKENPDHHGPIREGMCTGCHDPHASPRFRLLAAEYPADFYAAFDLERYHLCFTCHQQEMVTRAAGRGVTASQPFVNESQRRAARVTELASQLAQRGMHELAV